MFEDTLRSTGHGRIPVIIDTDPGVDDALAILLAIASPEIEILAYIVSFGNTDVRSSYLNILKIYQAVSRHLEHYPEDHTRFPNYSPLVKPFLAQGACGPLEGEVHSAQYFHGRDGLAGIAERHPEFDIKDETSLCHSWFEPTYQSGAELALQLIRSHPTRSITYLVLGPLTNLAAALKLDNASVIDRIGRVVCMGGALDVPGNTSPVAEFNFFADPYAVKELLTPVAPQAGLPLDRFLLLPLDVTTPHQLPFPYYRAHVDPTFVSSAIPSKSRAKPPITHFTSSFLERTREIMLKFGYDVMELHDIVAVWCAIENPPVLEENQDGIPRLRSGWKAVQRKFEIERTGELTRGMLVVDRRIDDGAYASGKNRAEVQAQLERLHFQHGGLASAALPAQVETGCPIETRTSASTVACITETPGHEALLRILLRRVWGVAVDE